MPIMETTEIARELDLCPAFMNAVLPLPSKVSMRPASNVSLSCDKQLLPFPLVSYTPLLEQRGYHLSQVFWPVFQTDMKHYMECLLRQGTACPGFNKKRG